MKTRRVTNRQEADFFFYFLDLNFKHRVKLKKLEISQAKDVPSQVQWCCIANYQQVSIFKTRSPD